MTRSRADVLVSDGEDIRDRLHDLSDRESAEVL